MTLRTRTGNSDNNKGGEGKGGTTTTPSTAKNVTRNDKKKLATTTAAKKIIVGSSPPPTSCLFVCVGNTMIKTKKSGLHTDFLVTYELTILFANWPQAPPTKIRL